MVRGLVVLLAALLFGHAAPAQTQITIGYGLAGDFLPAFVAKDEGIFAKNGLDASMKVMQSSSLVPAILASGGVQIGINTPPNLLLAAAGGLDQVAIAGAARLKRSDPRIGLVAKPGLSVTKPADLAGKRVGVPGINSVIDLVLKKWVIDGKVPLERVRFIEAAAPRMGDMLKSDQLDAVAIFEPLLSRFVASGAGVKSVDFFSEVNPDMLGSFWAATRQWASANPQAVASFRRSLAEAQDFIARDPEKAKAIEAKYLHFAEPKLPSFEVAMRAKDLDYFIALCRELGILHQPLDASKLIFE
ncbi:MAG: ABC transporter substrate-binding protein [Stellaceae bacterium]